MRKTTIVLLVIMALGATSCVIDGFTNTISGNGRVEEESREISGFTAVLISSGIDVYLSEGDDFEVRVEADENLLEVIETKLNGSMLEVGTDNVNIRNAKSKKVHISLPELSALRISSAGDCKGQTLFHCDNLDLSVSSAGDLSLEVEASRIDLDISSSGDVSLAGQAEEFDVSLSSAGDLHAFDLQAGRVKVSVSSAGDARVNASEEISMSASSAGNIYYKGEAKVIRSSTSSAGDIVKK